MQLAHKLRTTGLAGFVVLTAGCALTSQQKLAVQGFGSATASFATVARSEFIRSRQDVIEMNRLRVLLGDQSVGNLDGHFTLERVQVRLRALDALNEYGQLLQTLLVTASATELQGSADNLVASLQRVEGIRLEARQAEALGKAVTFGGGFLVEYKRAKAMKNVIALAHPHVLKIVEIVERDFDPNDDLWNAGYRHTKLDLEGAIQDLCEDAEDDLAGAQFVRGARLTAKENWLRFELVSQQIRQTAEDLRQAQNNLHDAMRSKEISIADVQEYREKVKELKALLEMLRPEMTR